MSTTAAGLLQVTLLLALLAAVYQPLGDYLARIYTTKAHLRVEWVIDRVVRVDPDAEQRWVTYAASVLGFSAVSIVFLYLLQRLQGWLPPYSGRSSWSSAGGDEPARRGGHHRPGWQLQHYRAGADRQSGSDQGTGHQWWRDLQRQLRPSVRKPNSWTNLLEIFLLSSSRSA
jgi:hypothetical protein